MNQFPITYDPRVFTVSAADVHLGALLAGGNWSVVSLIDQATGQIAIELSSSLPVSSMLAGSLITIDFHLNNPVGWISNPSYPSLVPVATPYGQYVATELEDAQGSFTLTLAPGNALDKRIDGLGTWVVSMTGAPAYGPSASSRRNASW